MKLTSRAFENGQKMDVTFTADGHDTSPPLAWSDVPSGTKSLALICDDPDAPSPKYPAPQPWVHWVIYNIPAGQSELPAGMRRASSPSELSGALQGRNSWSDDNVGYRGPAPPPKSGRHRYVFQLYALDVVLALAGGATKQELVAAMSGHVLAEAQLIGTYER